MTALGIGRRLARLAQASQVLVVTHLAQVAAYADRHLTVVKSRDGEVTVSGVAALDEAGRVRELARMLAGLQDSGTAQAHARELLATAEAEREGTRRRRASPSRRAVGSSTGEDAPDPAQGRP